MSAQITIKLSDEAKKTIREVREFPVDMLVAIAGAMKKENQLTVGYTQKTYLSFPRKGPPVAIGLRVQTNRLRASISASLPVVDPSGVTSSIGSNVEYAAVHEFGFDGEVSVGAHSRRRHTRQVIFGKTRKVRGADIAIGQHTRHMHMPARAPIQRGISDRVPYYEQAFSAAIVKAWKKGGTSS